MSQVTLTFNDDGKVSVEVKEVNIDSSIEEEPEVKKVVEEYLGKVTLSIVKIFNCTCAVTDILSLTQDDLQTPNSKA